MKKDAMNHIKKDTMKHLLTGVGIAIVIIITLLCIRFTQVESGELGVKYVWGEIQSSPIKEGLHFYNGISTEIRKANVKVQRTEMKSNAASIDLQEIEATFIINYQVKPEGLINLYKTVGQNYENIVLKPAIEEALKASTAKYTVEETITKRHELSRQVVEILQAKMEQYGIAVRDLNITNLSFSKEFNRVIEEKQIAEQLVKKAQQELEKAKVIAEKEIAEAKGKAESMRIQKQELSQEILMQLWIDKWDGKLPSAVIDSSSAILQLPSMGK